MYLQSIRKLFMLTIFLLGGIMVKQTVYAQKTSEADIVPQVVRVKLKPNAEKTFLALKQSKMFNGTLQMGQSTLDEICVNFNVRQIKRVFPFSPKFEARHRKHGLHLWYEITYKGDHHPKEVANLFKSYEGFELTKCVHKIARPNEQPKRIEPSGLLKQMSTDDPLLASQWHYNNTGQTGGTVGADISLLEAWESTMGSDQVVVAIIDGGIDYSHPDLEKNMWVNTGEIPGNGIDDDDNGYIDDVYGFNFVDGNGNIDPDNHGTHVAGTISASNNNELGVAGVAGGNETVDGAKLMSCEVFSSNSNGGFAQAFVYAADNGAVIAQNSWGHTSPGYSDPEILDAIDYFIEEAGQFEGSPLRGGIVFFAAGNSDSNLDYYPGYYERVVAVGATNHENQKSWYSNYGDWVDISAPGGETSVHEEGVLSTLANNSYGFYQGTSMACPHVSGIAALVLSNSSGSITNEELRELLESSVDSLDNLPAQYLGKMGKGLINAKKAVESAPFQCQLSPLDTLLVLDQEGSATQTIDIVNTTDTTLTFSFSTSENFASVSEETIAVQPNESASVEVMLDGTGVALGNYDLDIVVIVNDLRTKILRWEVDVVTTPQMVVGSSIQFGSVYLGYGKTQYLEFVNTTYSYLTLTDFEALLPDYVFNSDTLVVGPNGNAFLEVEFNPISGDDRSTIFTMKTNDPNNPNYSVDLIGFGNSNTPPTIVIPDSLIVQHSLPVEESVTFDLSNEGEDILSFAIQSEVSRNETPLLAVQFLNENLKKGEESKIQGRPKKYGFGEDTDSDYLWIDSEESNYVSFDWIELIGDPETVYIGGGDDAAYVYLFNEFSFEYYENLYNKVEISTNGTLSFNNRFSSFDYRLLPNSSIQTDLIAPYWRDLIMDGIYVKEFDDYVVIQYDGYYFSNRSLSVEFEVILYGNGNIKYQYKEVQEGNYSVGMQNVGGTKGVAMAYNNSYLQDSLAIMIRRDSFIEIITPENGDLAGYSSESIQVNYNTENVFIKGVSSTAQLIFQTNDPATPVKEMVFEVQHGGPILTYNDSFFSLVSYVDSVKHDTLTLYNEGFLPLEIIDITSSTLLLLFEDEPFTIAPKDSVKFPFSFSASEKNKYVETISFSTNDDTNQSVNIDLEYSIWNAYPHLILNHQPDSLSTVVLRDSVVTQSFTLTNDGEDTITYNIGIRKLQNNSATSFSLPKVDRPAQLSKKENVNSSNIPEQFWRSVQSKNIKTDNIVPYYEVPEGFAFGYLYDYNINLSGHASILPESDSSLTKYLLEDLPSDFRGAGEYLPSINKYIEFDNVGTFYLVDPVTEEVSEQGNLNIDVTGAAYNVISDELYICSGVTLFKFDFEGFVLTEIGSFGLPDMLMISISFDESGHLYGVEISNDILLKIDPTDASVEGVGYIGFDTNFGSGLAWDAINERMIMAAFNLNTYEFDFRQVDLQSGNTEFLSNELGGNFQFGWIAFQGNIAFSLDINKGKLAPGASQVVDFTTDTRWLEAGDHLFGIEINSNDQLHPYRQIPALISILDLTTTVDRIDFDSVANGYYKTKELYIVNNSSHSIYLDSISVINEVYSVTSQSGLLQPQDSVLLNVTFQPNREGVVYFHGDLVIHFENVTSIIPLTGRSYDNILPELIVPIEEQVIEKNALRVINLEQHFNDINLDTIHYEIELDNQQIIEASIENINQLVIYGKKLGVVNLSLKASDILETIEISFPITVTASDSPVIILDSFVETEVSLESSISYDLSQHFTYDGEDEVDIEVLTSESNNASFTINDQQNLNIKGESIGRQTYLVVITAEDESSTLELEVNVTEKNYSPEILKEFSDVNIMIDEYVVFNLDDYFTDVDDDLLLYSLGDYDNNIIDAVITNDQRLIIFALEEGTASLPMIISDGKLNLEIDLEVIVKKEIINSLINKSSVEVKLYPNPASTTTKILVELEKPTSIYLNLLDLSGKKIFTKSWEKVPQGSFQHIIDVSNLVSGIYIISITSEDGKVLTRRLTIQ